MFMEYGKGLIFKTGTARRNALKQDTVRLFTKSLRKQSLLPDVSSNENID